MTTRELLVGVPTVIESTSPVGPFAAVFEDDGETGYFYGLDTRLTGQRILDALLVYNASSVRDKDRPSAVSVEWSPDGNRAALFINGHGHAAFDFAAHRGYCRTNVPPDSSWSGAGHLWDDSVLAGLGPAA